MMTKKIYYRQGKTFEVQLAMLLFLSRFFLAALAAYEVNLKEAAGAKGKINPYCARTLSDVHIYFTPFLSSQPVSRRMEDEKRLN